MTEDIHTNERTNETDNDVSVSEAIGSAPEIARLTEAVAKVGRTLAEAETTRHERDAELQYARTAFSLVSERTATARATFDADESTKDDYLKAEAEERDAHADLQRAERRASAAASIESSSRADLEGLRSALARAERHRDFVAAAETEARAASQLTRAQERLRRAIVAETEAHDTWRSARSDRARTLVLREHPDLSEPAAKEAMLRDRLNAQLSFDLARVSEFFRRAREAIVTGIAHYKGEHFGADLGEARRALVALLGRDQFVPQLPSVADVVRGLDGEHGNEANHALASIVRRFEQSIEMRAKVRRHEEDMAEEARVAATESVTVEESVEESEDAPPPVASAVERAPAPASSARASLRPYSS